MTRRELLLAAAASGFSLRGQGSTKLTTFQIACMTLPYAQFPLAQALDSIARCGYRFVAWGTTHMESAGERRPVIPVEAPAAEAKRLAARCRDMGLEPVMMFSAVQ